MAKSKKNQIPPNALYLGLGGLIPFFTMALAAAFLKDASQDKATWALGAYGAVILSFLGGVNWGVLLHDRASLKRWKPLVLSVVPSIIAWLALLLPSTYMLSLLAAAMVLQYFLDTESIRQKILPAWYGRLRLILTTGAVISLLLGLVASSVGVGPQ